MPSGAGVIEYRGKRGTVWRIKFADATGRQVMETLGGERDGWSRKKAEAELRERLVKVERKNFRRPAPVTFAKYAEAWRTGCEGRRGWRPSTIKMRRLQVRRLTDYLGPMRLGSIRPTHVAAYIDEMSLNFAPATVCGDVDVLFEIFKTAKREESSTRTPPRARSGRRSRGDAGGFSSRSRSLGSGRRSPTSRRGLRFGRWPSPASAVPSYRRSAGMTST